MRTSPALAALPLTLVLSLGACADAPRPVASEASGGSSADSAFPVTVDNCGVTITIPKRPTKIVTLNQGVTEQALSLDLADQMAGTAYLDDAVAPELADAYATVPVLAKQYPSNEQMISAGSDLAIASYPSAFGDKGVGSREELAGRGTPTYIDPLACPTKKGAKKETPTFESIWSALTELGTLTGAESRAAELVTDQRARLEEASEGKPGAGRSVLWYDSKDATPTVGAGDGGPALILDAVGADNVFGDLEGGWADGSWERAVKADPDVIVLADASWSTAKEKQAYLEKDPVLKELTAVKEKRFITIPFSASTPGIQLVDGVEQVAEQLRALDPR